MANKKDLIDAQSFSRRRLLTAFVSGAPGGKELEPAKPMRAVVVGICLSVLIVVGGLFNGLLNSGLPQGWENNKVILVKETGERYVSMAGVLYPVINTTSARLVIPASEYKVITVRASAIEGMPVDATIGIVGAPDALPDAESLVADGWSACPVPDGAAVDLPGTATPATPSDAILVTNDGRDFVIVGSYRYRLGDERDQVVRQLGLASAVPLEVTAQWLNLFTEGAPLSPLVIEGAGDEIPGSSLVVGAAVRPTGGTDSFVVTADKKLAPLSPFAEQLYAVGTGALLGDVREVAPIDVEDFENASLPAGDDTWPEDILTPLPIDTPVCAVLSHDLVDGSPITSLGIDVPGAKVDTITMSPGAGALVWASGAGTTTVGTVQLIDSLGTAYPIPQADDETLARLGYTREQMSSIPIEWLQFFGSGPELSQEAAGKQLSLASQAAGTQVVPTVAPPIPGPTGDDEPSEEAADPETPASATAEPAATVQPSPTPERSPSVDGAVAGAVRSTLLPTSTTTGECKRGEFVAVREDIPAFAMIQAARLAPTWKGDGVVVAVVDSGIDGANDHFQGDVIVGGINLVPDGEPEDGLTDLAGHGTAVAGIIAAQERDGSSIVGLAPEVSLLSVRVFRDESKESADAGFGPDASRMAEGIRWAADNGADIINVSMSMPENTRELKEAVDYAVASGALVVASAGNRNTSASTVDGPRYPAAYDGALAVSAANSEGVVDDNSIHGDHVLVSAPGQVVPTAFSGGLDCIVAQSAASPSYATAYASAAAALVAQAHPDESPLWWAYRLQASALRNSPDTADISAGWGLIQPYSAITMVVGDDVRGPVMPSGERGEPVALPEADVRGSIQPDPYERATAALAAGAVIIALIWAALAALGARKRGGGVDGAGLGDGAGASAPPASGGDDERADAAAGPPRRAGLLDRAGHGPAGE